VEWTGYTRRGGRRGLGGGIWFMRLSDVSPVRPSVVSCSHRPHSAAEIARLSLLASRSSPLARALLVSPHCPWSREEVIG
jgi:hypothetical protein